MTDKEKEIGIKFLTRFYEIIEGIDPVELRAAKKNLFLRIANAHNNAEDNSMWYLLNDLVVIIEKFKALYG